MKKTLVVALFALLAIGANAADKKEGATSNKPVFTVVKQIPITSIKDQNRSGTCWDYSTLSYFEAEILKKKPSFGVVHVSIKKESSLKRNNELPAPASMRPEGTVFWVFT